MLLTAIKLLPLFWHYLYVFAAAHDLSNDDFSAFGGLYDEDKLTVNRYASHVGSKKEA